jgi:hypothetical protein
VPEIMQHQAPERFSSTYVKLEKCCMMLAVLMLRKIQPKEKNNTVSRM